MTRHWQLRGMTESSTAIALAAGGFGGACLASVGAPFDILKTRQQIDGSHSVFTLVRSIIKAEGVRGFWRGSTPPVVAAVPQFAIVFAAFDYNRNSLVPAATGLHAPDMRNTALAGGLVAVPTSFLYTPFDRVKCALQAEGRRIERGRPARFGGAWSCALELWRRRTLLRGFWITLARDVPAWATYFVVYSAAKRHLAASSSSAALDGHAELSVGASLAAGAMAGASTWAVAIPADVIKTRFQARTYHATYAHAARAIAARHGFLGFFAGFWTIVLGGVPRDAACFCGVEAATRGLTLLVGG